MKYLFATTALYCMFFAATAQKFFYDDATEKWGLKAEDGRVIVQPKYTNSYYFGPSFGSQGLANVQTGNGTTARWGYIDKTGKEVIPFLFAGASEFTVEGMAAVKLKDKWGFIDRTGKLVIAPKYDYVEYFYGAGLAAVNIGGTLTSMGYVVKGKWGFIDKTGKEVVPLKYDSKESFVSAEQQLTRVAIGSYPDIRYGYIDRTGKEVIPLIYEYADDFFRNGKAEVKLKGMSFNIDPAGKEIRPKQLVSPVKKKQ
jgi:hypothetical protein